MSTDLAEELTEVRRQRDKAEAIVSDRGEQLDKTERYLRVERQKATAAIRVLREDADHKAKLRRELRKVTAERNRLQVSEARLRDGTVRVESPRQKALDALGVAERRLAATEHKIDALKSQAAALLPDREAQTAEVACLAQHPLLIADSGSPS